MKGWEHAAMSKRMATPDSHPANSFLPSIQSDHSGSHPAKWHIPYQKGASAKTYKSHAPDTLVPAHSCSSCSPLRNLIPETVRPAPPSVSRHSQSGRKLQALA